MVIPLGTILLEEVAFRSVLWGMLSRHATTWRVRSEPHSPADMEWVRVKWAG